MQIYIAKSGVETGPFTGEQIPSMLDSGMLCLTDSVWHEGLPQWIPVHQFLSLRPPLPDAGVAPLVPPTGITVAEEIPATKGRVQYKTVVQTMLPVIVTLGLFSFYLVATYAPQVEKITGRKRLDFPTVLILTCLTCGLFGAVYQTILAYHLWNHSENHHIAGRNRSLLGSVGLLNLLSYGAAFASSGIALPMSVIWSAYSL